MQASLATSVTSHNYNMKERKQAATILHTAHIAVILHTAHMAVMFHTAHMAVMFHTAHMAVMFHTAHMAVIFHTAHMAVILHTAHMAVILHTRTWLLSSVNYRAIKNAIKFTWMWCPWESRTRPRNVVTG